MNAHEENKVEAENKLSFTQRMLKKLKKAVEESMKRDGMVSRLSKKTAHEKIQDDESAKEEATQDQNKKEKNKARKKRSNKKASDKGNKKNKKTKESRHEKSSTREDLRSEIDKEVLGRIRPGKYSTPTSEEEKERQQELLNQFYRNYQVVGKNVYLKDRLDEPAFKDTGKGLITRLNDSRVGYSMAFMAEAKGWKAIKVSGHDNFCRDLWLEASLRGIEVKGYKPTQQDLAILEAHREPLMKNRVEPIQSVEKVQETQETKDKNEPSNNQENYNNKEEQPTHEDFSASFSENKEAEKPHASSSPIYGNEATTHEGKLVQHRAAPFEFKKGNSESYSVILETAEGYKVVWGIDLERAIKESGAHLGDSIKLENLGKKPVTVKEIERDEKGNKIGEKEISTYRNTWQATKVEKNQEVHKDEKIVGEFAAKVVAQYINTPEVGKAVLARIQEEFDKKIREKSTPNVSMYDKNAKSSIPEQEKTNAQMQKTAERTR